jgi:hypothetical protein
VSLGPTQRSSSSTVAVSPTRAAVTKALGQGRSLRRRNALTQSHSLAAAAGPAAHRLAQWAGLFSWQSNLNQIVEEAVTVSRPGGRSSLASSTWFKLSGIGPPPCRRRAGPARLSLIAAAAARRPTASAAA